ncbi:MAG: ATP-binding cassette domain-containing protein [Eggerthella lenta]
MPENVNTSSLAAAVEDLSEDNRRTMVKVDHVSMIFNMASEQLNSLKEYAIQIARRKLFFEGFTALDDVSFEVKKGDVFGIIGTNGSGKSTMLKIIAGVLEPTKGTCEINGNIAPLIELGAGFDTELSARENIYLNGALLGYSKEFINDHFDEIVEFAEIEKFLDMPLKNYSSGMVARIAFAIATVIVPEILVVDEVLSVGDFMFQKKCEDRISELIEKHGVTVLIVSHSNAQVERLCNKVIWIEKGHTRMMGDAASVCRVYGGLGGRTGSAEAEQRVFEALQRSGEHEESDFSTIAGDDANGTAVQLAYRGWENGFDTAVVVCASTHINAIMANGLAGAVDAPVLPVKPDRIPDAVASILRRRSLHHLLRRRRAQCGRAACCPRTAFSWSPAIIPRRRRKPVRPVFGHPSPRHRARVLGGRDDDRRFRRQPRIACGSTACKRCYCPVIATRGAISYDALESAVHEAGTIEPRSRPRRRHDDRRSFAQARHLRRAHRLRHASENLHRPLRANPC